MFWIVHIERKEQPIGKTSLLERQLTAVFVLLISLYGYSYTIFYIKIQTKLFHGLHANKHLFLATFHLLQVLHQSQIKKTCTSLYLHWHSYFRFSSYGKRDYSYSEIQVLRK